MESELLFPEKEISQLKITGVIKRDGRIVAFDRRKIEDSIFRAAVDVGGSDRQIAELLAADAVRSISAQYAAGVTPSVEEIQDIIERTLVAHGHYRTAKAYILYRAEHARIREEKNDRIVAEDNVPYKVLWKVFTWNVDHGCDTIEKINRHIHDGTFAKLVADCERAYHAEIRAVAAKILSGIDRYRMIIVAGPSSSGKTTTTTKISEQLKKHGIEFVLMNLDNYFRNLEEHPVDEYGDYDFEAPEALDLDMINDHLFRLLRGETVNMPEYNFKTGKRRFNVRELTLKPNQMLLLDSLHGLFPAMTASVPHEMKFKFYIEALCQLRDSSGEFMRWTDLRMLRRMVRDSWHRSYNPEQTVGHWHYVRRSEKKHIVPFIAKADYVFNGAMAYELPVYKKHLFSNLSAIPALFEKDPKRMDAYIRSRRVASLLAECSELQDETLIPSNSLVREFIGGSSYHY